ncbi:MAG: VCBS repeat-containing protein, partial [Thermoflexales bacterium]|nr:VCBS repeat-containing protein [Thermoflexales bacterium]
RPSTAPMNGALVGTFGVCAGEGIWCQHPQDTAASRALRLAGNHRSDNGNPWSSDLNGDGVPELLVANWWDNAATHAFEGGWIFWGLGIPRQPRWDAAARTTLQGIGAHGMLPADLNGDGLPEIVLSNFRSNETRNVNSYIYWGRAAQDTSRRVAYSSSDRTELPAPGAHGIAIADLNHDGRPEIVLARANDDRTHKIESYIYWGQAGGRYGVTYSPAARTALPTQGAHGVAVADLNRDGLPELVFANKFDSEAFVIDSDIYWARPGGTYGVSYSPTDRTTLTTQGAFSVAVADLNKDGRPEVIFANWSDGKTYAVNSYVYWGQAVRPYQVVYSPAARTELPGVGAMKASVADVDNDGNLDVVLQNYDGGFVRVFWGPLPKSGVATNFWTLPQAFGFRGLSLSDLNGDGFIDLLTAQQGIDPDPGGRYWEGGVAGHVHLHRGIPRAPYAAAPTLRLPVLSAASIYASSGVARGSNGEWFSQPRSVYGTSYPAFGVLESVAMSSDHTGSTWTRVQTLAQIAPGTGITLYIAASDNLAALNNPTWVEIGAVGNGTWSRALNDVKGRFARYRVVLWRDQTTEASPALQRVTFDYRASN